MEKLFRILVVISISSFLIWFILPQFWHLWHTPEEVNMLNYNGYNEYFNALPLLYIMAVLFFVASIGLLLFKSWARTLFILLTLLSVFGAPFMGWSIETGVEASLSQMGLLCDGAIIFMEYFSSVSTKFTKSV